MIYSVWDFAGFVMMVCLCTVQARAGSFMRILIAFPSTLLHESCHAIVAFVTGGRVTSFSVLPRRRTIDTITGKRRIWMLGQVGANVGTSSAAPTALAPLLLLVPAFYIFSSWPQHFSSDGPGVLYAYYLIFVFLFGSMPSTTDIKILFTQPKSTGLYIVAVIAATLLWRYASA